MILNRIIKRITKITKFEVKKLTTVFKWKMPFFYSQEGVNPKTEMSNVSPDQNECFLKITACAETSTSINI